MILQELRRILLCIGYENPNEDDPVKLKDENERNLVYHQVNSHDTT